MKTFEQICQEIESNENSTLNKSWQEAKEEKKKLNRISIVICIIVDALLIGGKSISFLTINNFSSFMFMHLFITLLFAVIIDMVIFAVINMIFGKKQKEYRKNYKNLIIRNVMSNFYNNLEYFPQKQLPRYVYDEGEFGEFYDEYISEDYLEANLDNNCGIQMGEVETKKTETYTDSEGRTKTRTVTVFYGLVTKITMEKSINSKIKIMQNGKFFLSGNRLKMDSSEFEKYFDVQATDKIHGMQLLTADVMEDLIEFQNQNKVRFDVVIYNNNIYIRFHCGEMFEPSSISKGPIHKESLKKYYNILNFTSSLSNKLVSLIKDTEF